MTKSPRLEEQPGRTKTQPPAMSATKLMFVTALDTTWRAFVPTLGGTFLGIGVDKLFSISPIGLIVCLILGVAISAALITLQLRAVRKLR